MDALDAYTNLTMLDWHTIIGRISMAIVFGLVLGLDRESKDKPIDFRAYMIVAVTTCIIAMMSLELFADYKNTEDFISLDFGKIIAGVMTGIGFLGAGAIIKVNGTQLIGTATGASIWAAGTMGLIIGYGFYSLAFLGFGAIALILIVGGWYIDHFGNAPKQKPGKNKT